MINRGTTISILLGFIALPFGAPAQGREPGKSIGAGQALWSLLAEPHTLENVGDADIHVVTVELKPNARG